MVCTDWPNITAPYGPGVGRRRKRRWSLKVTLRNSLFFCCWCCREDGGGGALALKVSWHNSLEFGNASSLLVHSCCCCTSSLDWVVQSSIKRCQQSMCGEVDEPPMHCNVVLHCSAAHGWMWVEDKGGGCWMELQIIFSLISRVASQASLASPSNRSNLGIGRCEEKQLLCCCFS